MYNKIIIFIFFSVLINIIYACNDLWIDGGKSYTWWCHNMPCCTVKNHCSTTERILCPDIGDILNACSGNINGGYWKTYGCFDFYTIPVDGMGGACPHPDAVHCGYGK